MKVLGIESSCDETAAAVVEDGFRLLSDVKVTQIDIHEKYGGVVPEISARSHIEAINPVIDDALAVANCSWEDIDAIAVTYAPGLVGSLLIGTLAARTLAVIHDKPLYAVHHVEAHVYANFITEQKERLSNHLSFPSKQPTFPMLALIVSGGHTQLVLFRDHGDYVLLGQTQDDAIGEAYDKVAKILGLPYPGGVSISKVAPLGDAQAVALPKAQLQCPPECKHEINPVVTQEDIDAGRVIHGGRGQVFLKDRCHKYDFSFSGLKTAVLRAVQSAVGKDYTFPSHELPALLDDVTRNNFAASFQRVANETLVDKAIKAFEDYRPQSVVIAGGVAADRDLRKRLADRLSISIEYAPMQLCTDNAAMIAALGYYQAQSQSPCDPYTLEVIPSLSMTKTAWAKEE